MGSFKAERSRVVSSLLFVVSGLSSRAFAADFDAHRIWTVHGHQPGAGFGEAVASAGDVNGDGFPDVIVGVPDYDGAGGVDCGRAIVYYGSATGLPSSPSWIAEGEPARFSSHFGWAVGPAGDVNGDGFDDVVIGTYFFDPPGTPSFALGEGRIYVYYGSAQGLGLTPSFVADGWGYDLGLRTGLGYTVTSGDFNGDGFSDVAASSYSRYLGGAAVYYGSASGLSASHSWRSLAPALDMGASVSAGDFNGDAYDDLLVTTKDEDPGSSGGTAVIFLGSSTGLLALPDSGYYPPAVPPSFVFPDWVDATSVGDVDGDGYDDLLVVYRPFFPSSQFQAPFAHHVLYRGSPSGPAPGGELGAVFGGSGGIFGGHGRLSALGDLNGDGFADAIAQDDRRFYVYFGSASGFDPFSNGIGTPPPTAFANAGDVNGDGIGDVITGDGAEKRVDVYRGATDWSFSATADLSVRQELFIYPPFTYFGVSVTNNGPGTVRVRLVDHLPPALSSATWSCFSPGSDVASRCPSPMDMRPVGDIDDLITMDPGGTMVYEIIGPAVSVHTTNIATLVLPDWVVDPDPSNNQATLELGPPNRPPVANAGPDQAVIVGHPVVLNGSASLDPDGDPLTYQWSFVAVPAGSALVSLTGAGEEFVFVPDLEGTYTARLVVSDGELSSPPAYVDVDAVRVDPNVGLPPLAHITPLSTTLVLAAA